MNIASLLLGNTLVEAGAGLGVLFAPEAMVNPPLPSGTIPPEFIGGAGITAFGRSLFGRAALALALSTFVAYWRLAKERPSKSLLCGLAFYHLSVIPTCIKELGFNAWGLQYPALLAHLVLGLGFSRELLFGGGKE